MPSAATLHPAGGLDPPKSISQIGPLFPDELIWSGCARLKQRYPRLTDKEITHWVTGGRTAWTSFVQIALPSNAKVLAQSFGYDLRWRQLIWNHTFWPWLAAFLPAAGRKDHEHDLYSDDRIEYLPWVIKHQRGALTSYTIAARLRACPQCAAADQKKYGVIYWHRLHQFRGIHTCPEHLSPLVEIPVNIQWDHKYYIPLTWPLISNGRKFHPPDVLQRFLAKNISMFIKMRRPVAGEFFAMGVRLRNAMWRAGLPVLCHRNSTLVQARLIAEFGRKDVGSSSDDWGTLLFHPNGDLPLPVHTLMICRLLGVSPRRAFDIKWRAAEYADHNGDCFQGRPASRRRIIAAYVQQHRRSPFPRNSRVCRECRALLKGKYSA